MRRRHKQGPLSTDGMRSMWEFVFVSQFLRVFQRKFSFVLFTAEELENAFLEATNPALFGIFSKLLRTVLPKQDIKTTTWQEALKEELEKRNSEWNPFNGGKSYEHFSVENRVLLLKNLIQFVADDKDKELKKFSDDFLNPDNSSVKPIGNDASNNVYWYFDDLRLYREAAGTKGSHSGWETVCVNCADWEKLLRTFQKSADSNERKLYKYLKDELYPTVMPTVKENEKEKELETMIKKRSPKKQHKEVSRRKRDRNVVLKKEEQGLERSKRDKKKDKDQEEEEEEDGGEETEEDEEDVEEFVEEVEAEEEEESGEEEYEGEEGEEASLHPFAKETKEKPLSGEKEPRRRGRPAGSRASNTIQGSSERGGRKRKRSDIEKELMVKEMEERKELERRVDEEIEKQESMITASGVDSRAKRRCVIMREQLSQKKKEWWEEEGLGSDSENDEERDFDSDGSDRPRRRRKTKIPKPVEMPEPPNRIYVFSTGLANRASEAVQQGKFETITAYHRAQPASSPFLQVERANSMSYFGKQRPYYSKPYSMGGSANTMGQMTGYSGMSAGMQRADRQPSARPGYGASQWDQYQTQQLYKDRHRQAQTQAMDDIHQLLFGSSHGGNAQGAMGVNGMYSRSGYHNQQGGAVEPSSTYSGYPTQQHQAPYGDRRVQDSRGQTQQSKFQAFPTQQQQQQPPPQGYFQRSRHLVGLQSQGNGQSPSSDPLGVGVRSPPPYPGGRPPDSRHQRNSPNPVPSPTSTGSPHTPQTPLTPQTPHTPRFPGPSPTEPAKPPFSPSHPQGSMCGPTMPNYPAQAPPTVTSSSEERPMGAQPRPGYIELSSKPMQRGMQNPFPSVIGNYNQVQSPLDGRRPEDNKSPGFGSPNNHESPLHSPTDHAPAQHYNSGPPNKSPFIRQGVQPILNHSPFSTSASVVPGSKSFSVESLTAPSQTFLDKGSLPPSQLSEQPMPQYSGLYFPSNKYSPMFGQPQYQYPSHIQHAGAFYNSQLTPNMYLGRASLPVYPPNRDSGL